VHALKREYDAARREIDEAIRCAPARAFYFAQKALILLQAGDYEAAARSVEDACCLSPDNPFDTDLVVAHYMVLGDRGSLARIAEGKSNRRYTAGQRGQAMIALGDHDAARRLYDSAELERGSEVMKLATDDWVWRLPHVVNRAHLWLLAGDSRGKQELEGLLADLGDIAGQGVKNPLTRYWAATANAVLGRTGPAHAQLAEARSMGWNHDWWERLDWNAERLKSG
jgi:tetratricopeptide (TPR) repeat protein